MSISARALWFIESHLSEGLSLDNVAGAVGVSRFHLSRVFPVVVGHAFAQYIRARRLSEAARALAAGAPDILDVALDPGYSGVAVREFPTRLPEFACILVPAHKNAVFEHKDHILTIASTFSAIWNRSLTDAGLKAADAPILEVYGEEFDGHTGFRGLEIRVSRGVEVPGAQHGGNDRMGD
ncbi:MAG: helix-turn-helix domain-containing protein [Acidobacteriota bacterium]|nr:helix-turn-helix domain-containing protein [Acidobacteriota bacterium]